MIERIRSTSPLRHSGNKQKHENVSSTFFYLIF